MSVAVVVVDHRLAVTACGAASRAQWPTCRRPFNVRRIARVTPKMTVVG
jgi:hypothetical protein